MSSASEVASTRAVTRAYVQQHKLDELFAHLLQLLLYHQPANPRAFLVQELQQLRAQQDKTTSSTTATTATMSSSLFTERDLETMFDLTDVTRQQWITVQQLRNMCCNLATTAMTSNSSGDDDDDTRNGTSSARQQRRAARPQLDDALEQAIATAADAHGHVTLDAFKRVLSMLLLTRNVWSTAATAAVV